MTAAALGTTVELETLDGTAPIEVKSGTQSGQVITLRAKGVNHLRSSGRGDLYVHVDVVTPTKLDERQTELLRELATLRGEERATGTVSSTSSPGGLFSRLRDAFNSFFLVAPSALATEAGSTIVIEGAEGRHAATVKRLAAGEPVLVGDGQGRVAEGVVSAVIGRDVVEVQVRTVTSHPTPSPRVVVVQALAKGDRGDLAVELVTEVGADVVVPWSASRSVSVWKGDKAERGVDRWRVTAREASKQSRRPYVPDVRALATTADVVARIRAAVDRGGVALVLHEAAVRRLADVALPHAGDVVVVVGPEGGISGDELEAFADAGAHAVRLGPSVMRTSTAGAVAASLVLSATGRWA